jgi:ligand-binding sensor domain-containing protein
MNGNHARFLWQVAALSSFLLVSGLRAHAEPLNWWTFTARNELPTPQGITALRATRDGHVWCATAGGGVMRYDGEGWRVHRKRDGRLSDDNVETIHERPDGTLWFATRRGVSVYRLKEERWVTKDFSPLTRLAQLSVSDIAEQPAGTLWFATRDAGVFGYDLQENSWKQLSRACGDLSNNSVVKLLAQSNGALWICYNGGGLSARAPDGTMEHITGLSGGKVMSACEWSDGTLWFGISVEGGVYVFDGKQPPAQRWRRRQLRDQVPQRILGLYVNAMMEMPNGDRWLATNGQGLLVFDKRGNPRKPSWDAQHNGLVSDKVTALCRRRDGTLWFGTPFGVSVYQPNRLQDVSDTMPVPEGRMWRATEDGKFDLWNAASRAFEPVSLPAAMAKERVFGVVEDGDGIYWVGTSEGLWCYRRQTNEWFVLPAPSPPSLVKAPARVTQLASESSSACPVKASAQGVLDARSLTATALSPPPPSPRQSLATIAAPQTSTDSAPHAASPPPPPDIDTPLTPHSVCRPETPSPPSSGFASGAPPSAHAPTGRW